MAARESTDARKNLVAGGSTTWPFQCSIVAFLPYDLTQFPGELGIFSVDTRDRFA